MAKTFNALVQRFHNLAIPFYLVGQDCKLCIDYRYRDLGEAVDLLSDFTVGTSHNAGKARNDPETIARINLINRGVKRLHQSKHVDLGISWRASDGTLCVDYSCNLDECQAIEMLIAGMEDLIGALRP